MLYSRKEAIIEHLRTLDFHGLPFFDVYYKYTDSFDAPTHLARIAGEMTYPGMQVGDRVLVEKIAHTVIEIEKL